MKRLNRLADRVVALKPSLTREIFELAKKFDDVVDLTLGDPDLLPPKEIRDAACWAIHKGLTRYSQNAGLPEVRSAVAGFNSRFYGRKISPDEVVITCGGMEAVYLSLASLVQAGDEVIIPGPYWINYRQMTELCGAKAVIVSTSASDDFSISLDLLEKVLSPRSKVLIINSPNNPTGRMLQGKSLDKIAKFAVAHDLFVISDEVYRSLVYDGKRHESIWTRPNMRDRCAIIDSMSKRFSMTGYRLGMAIAPRALVTAMTRFQENVAACAPLPSQYAALAAYSQDIDCSYMLDEFASRRKAVYDGVSTIPELSVSAIDGTFYAFVNISKTRLNSYDFSLRLLNDVHVAVVPGRTYGGEYDDFVRIAFTLKVPRINEAFRRIRKFVKEICG